MFESISLQQRVGSKLGSDLRALLNQGEATDQVVCASISEIDNRAAIPRPFSSVHSNAAPITR
jgi:hypothetical protein